MYNLFSVHFVNFYKFRTYLGPSSGGTTVCMQLVPIILLTCLCLTAEVHLLTSSDSWHHHNGDWHVWAQNAERRGGGWTIHPSRRWLISCARTAVSCVCLSMALTSCTTSMAETNLAAIRKQKNAEYSKRYRLKWKMQMQQQAPTTSEAEPEKLQVEFLPYGTSIGSCICLNADLYVSHGFAGKKYNRYVNEYVWHV